jgi:hypothetical protein
MLMSEPAGAGKKMGDLFFVVSATEQITQLA